MISTVTQIRQLAVAALIVCLVWFSILAAPAHAADADDFTVNERGNLQTTERYDEIQPQTGGMNRYADTDPRRDTARAEAKAKALSDQAERTKKMADDPFEPTRETLSNTGDYVKGGVERAKNAVQDALD